MRLLLATLSGRARRASPEASARLRLGARVGHDPVCVTLLTLPVAMLGWYLADPGASAAQLAVFGALHAPLNVVMFLVVRRVAQASAAVPATYRFWRAFTFAGACFAIGTVTDLFVTLVRTGRPPDLTTIPAIIFFFTFAGASAIVWAMLTHPTAVRSRRERARFWLDAGTVLVGAAAFDWYFAVGPALPDGGAVALVKALPTAGVMLVTVFAVTKLLLGGSAPISRAAATPMIVAAVIVGCGPVLPAAGTGDRYRVGVQGLFVLTAVLVALGLRIQQLQAVAVGAAARPATTRRRPYSLLPYSAIAATDVLLLVALPRDLTPRVVGVLLGVLAISALVVARQLAAFTDNADLLVRLDATMGELRRHEQRFRSLLEHSCDITTIVATDGRLTYASPAMGRVLGRPPAEVVGQALAAHVHPDDRAWLLPQLEALAWTHGAAMTYQARFAHADGGWRWLEVICTNLVDDPDVAGFVCNAREVTEARQLQDELRHQASHDALTQLANRALFTERLAQAVDADTPAAVLLIDLDDFKVINDTLGHHVGDAVLMAVAERIRAAVRLDRDTPARLGGDEFAVLLPHSGTADATAAAERLIAGLTEPIDADGHELTVRASVGIAVGGRERPDALLRAADRAMYAAKRDGKGRHSGAVPDGGHATRTAA